MRSDRSVGMEGAWYVRRNDGVRGLYPAGAIAQDLVLGRLDSSAEVSRDGVQWVPLMPERTFVRGAIPSAGTSGMGEDDWITERLRAHARWADERTGHERRSLESGEGLQRRQGRDRRQASSRSRRLPHAVRATLAGAGNDRLVATLIGLLALACVAALLSLGGVNPIPVKLHAPALIQPSD